MAVHVEDHPVSYGSFEGTIPREAVRRRQGHRLGPRHLGAGRRPARGHGARASSCSSCTARSWPACGSWCGSPSPATSRTRGCCSRSATSGRARKRTTTSIAALPDSVIEKPLGAARAARAARRSAAPRQSAPAAAIAGPSCRTRSRPSCRRSWRRSWRRSPKSVPAQRQLDLRDQVRRLPAAGAHRRQGAVAAVHAQAATTGPSKLKPLAETVKALERALDLARRRDRRARRRRHARLQRAAERLRRRAHRRASCTSCSTCRTSTATTCAACRCVERRALLKQLARREAAARRCASAPTSMPTRHSILRIGARAEARRHHRQARRRALRVRSAPRRWLKLKCAAAAGVRHRRLHRPHRRRSAEVGSLLLGYHDEDGKLRVRRQRRHRLEFGDGRRPAQAARRSSRCRSRRSSPAARKPGRWRKRVSGASAGSSRSWSPR